MLHVPPIATGEKIGNGITQTSPRFAHTVPVIASSNLHSYAPTPPPPLPSPGGYRSIGTLQLLGLCVIWYSSSALTGNSSKLILNSYNYPVTLTTLQFGLAALATLFFCKLFRLTTIKWPTRNILITILPLCFFQVGGHFFTSISLSYLPVSIVHTVKATSPLFTVFIYTWLYKLQYPPKVYTSLIPLSVGVALTLINKVVFHPVGFLTSMISCIIFVIQNIFSKQLFNTTNGIGNDKINPSKLDKLNLLFYSNLTAFICSVPIWIRQDILAPTYEYPDLYIMGIFVVNGMSHFMQNWLAFHLLSLVSPVTYSIASLIKRIYVIVASIVWFGDAVTPLQTLGIGLTFVGLWLYQDAKKEIDLREGLVEDKEVLPSHSSVSFNHIHAK